MLDDLKYIHQRDKSDALGIAEKQWQQLQQEYGVAFPEGHTFSNVVVAGMGGSALAAEYVPTWPGLTVPYQVVKNYALPDHVGKDTLLIASSYSGNTEETLSALDEAEKAGAFIAVISAGGKLAERAEEKAYPYYKLPSDFQPRMAAFYNFAALTELLISAGLVDASAKEELKAAAEFVRGSVSKWRPDVATSTNQAKQIALELVGKSPVIYSGHEMYPAAYKWKISVNENAKNVAWCNHFPEFSHNEFLGWSSHPLDKPYTPVFLRSSFDHPQVAKRFGITRKLLSGRLPEPVVVEAEGASPLEQIVWLTVLGDFVSLYLALLNNLDPTPVELITKLKEELVK